MAGMKQGIGDNKHVHKITSEGGNHSHPHLAQLDEGNNVSFATQDALIFDNTIAKIMTTNQEQDTNAIDTEEIQKLHRMNFNPIDHDDLQGRNQRIDTDISPLDHFAQSSSHRIQQQQQQQYHPQLSYSKSQSGALASNNNNYQNYNSLHSLPYPATNNANTTNGPTLQQQSAIPEDDNSMTLLQLHPTQQLQYQHLLQQQHSNSLSQHYQPEKPPQGNYQLITTLQRTESYNRAGSPLHSNFKNSPSKRNSLQILQGGGGGDSLLRKQSSNFLTKSALIKPNNSNINNNEQSEDRWLNQENNSPSQVASQLYITVQRQSQTVRTPQKLTPFNNPIINTPMLDTFRPTDSNVDSISQSIQLPFSQHQLTKSKRLFGQFFKGKQQQQVKRIILKTMVKLRWFYENITVSGRTRRLTDQIRASIDDLSDINYNSNKENNTHANTTTTASFLHSLIQRLQCSLVSSLDPGNPILLSISSLFLLFNAVFLWLRSIEVFFRANNLLGESSIISTILPGIIWFIQILLSLAMSSHPTILEYFHSNTFNTCQQSHTAQILHKFKATCFYELTPLIFLCFSSENTIISIILFLPLLLKLKSMLATLHDLEFYAHEVLGHHHARPILSSWKLFWIIAVTVHAQACVFRAIGEEELNSLNYDSNSVSKYLQVNDDDGLEIKYIQAIYWALNILSTTSSAEARTNLEIFYACLCIISSFFIIGYSFCKLSHIMAQISNQSRSDQIHQDISQLNRFLKNKSVSIGLRRKAALCIKESTGKVSDFLEAGMETFKRLPQQLAQEIQLQTNQMIKQTFASNFGGFSKKFIEKLFNNIQEESFAPGELILCSSPQYNQEYLFFLSSGEAIITIEKHKSKDDNNNNNNEEESQDGSLIETRVIKRIKKGDIFGSYGFFTGMPDNMLSCESSSNTTVIRISRKRVYELSMSFPSDLERFCYIRDTLLFSTPSRLSTSGFTCVFCSSRDHLPQSCNKVFFSKSLKYCLWKQNYHFQQERNTGLIRRIYKSKNSRHLLDFYQIAAKAMQTYMKNRNELQSSSSFETHEDSDVEVPSSSNSNSRRISDQSNTSKSSSISKNTEALVDLNLDDQFLLEPATISHSMFVTKSIKNSSRNQSVSSMVTKPNLIDPILIEELWETQKPSSNSVIFELDDSIRDNMFDEEKHKNETISKKSKYSVKSQNLFSLPRKGSLSFDNARTIQKEIEEYIDRLQRVVTRFGNVRKGSSSREIEDIITQEQQIIKDFQTNLQMISSPLLPNRLQLTPKLTRNLTPPVVHQFDKNNISPSSPTIRFDSHFESDTGTLPNRMIGGATAVGTSIDSTNPQIIVNPKKLFSKKSFKNMKSKFYDDDRTTGASGAGGLSPLLKLNQLKIEHPPKRSNANIMANYPELQHFDKMKNYYIYYSNSNFRNILKRANAIKIKKSTPQPILTNKRIDNYSVNLIPEKQQTFYRYNSSHTLPQPQPSIMNNLLNKPNVGSSLAFDQFPQNIPNILKKSTFRELIGSPMSQRAIQGPDRSGKYSLRKNSKQLL